MNAARIAKRQFTSVGTNKRHIVTAKAMPMHHNVFSVFERGLEELALSMYE